MNRKAFLVIAVLLVLITVLIALVTIKRSPEQSGGRDAIFIGDEVPAYALLKMKDKIYALGGGVAVIFSEDLSPLCYAKFKYNIIYGKLRIMMKRNSQQYSGGTRIFRRLEA